MGLVVGAFMVSGNVAPVAASSSAVQAQSLDRLFSSDGPESLHEAKNQGTNDEPKAWPEANAWLHAQLSDAERDFLALAVTGTVSPTADYNGGMSAAQIADATATVQTTVRFTYASLPAGFSTQLIADLVAGLSKTAASAITYGSATPVTVGTSLETVVTWTFHANGANTAGQQWQQFAASFGSASSVLRTTTTLSRTST